MSRALVIVLLLLAAAPGYSAVVIGLEHTGDSPFRTYSSETIFIDGAALRVDLDLLPDISHRELTPDQFEVPSGYRNQEPVIASPGSE